MENTLNSKEIEVIKQETSPLITQATSYEIVTEQDVDEASVFLKQVNDKLKNIEDKRLEFTAPLNKSLQAINATFKLLKAPLEGAKALLSSKILSWRQIENEKIRKEEERRRKIQEAHELAGHQVSAPVELQRPEKSIGNTQTRLVWKWRVLDKTKVSDRFKEVNPVLVNAVVRSTVIENDSDISKIKNALDGIEIYQEETLAIVNR